MIGLLLPAAHILMTHALDGIERAYLRGQVFIRSIIKDVQYRFLVPCLLGVSLCGFGQTSTLVTQNDDGTLTYAVDGDGNRLPDFAYAGYKLGKVPIPQNVPTAVTVSPVAGDDTSNIQAAIDQVEALSLDSNGFRGVVLLSAGVYDVSSTLQISSSGVVLRGEGAGQDGTVIFHAGTDSEDTVHIGGGSLVMTEVGSVTSAYVPVGQKTLLLSDVSGLTTGQSIAVICKHTQQWINALGLASYWTNPAELDIRWERVITAINTSTKEITLDAPLTSIIDQQNGYAQAIVCEVADTRVTNIGIEDILFVSDYDRSELDGYGYYNDEDHANTGIHFTQAKDCWVQRCTGFFYHGSFVYCWTNCNRITVQDCAMLDGVSHDTPNVHAGGKEYAFCMNGSNILVQRCFARGARHAFITNGPKSNIAFLDCYSLNGHLAPEPHQLWTSAVAYDNVYSDSQFKLEGNLSLHGQKAANSILWNCFSDSTQSWNPEIQLNHAPGTLAKNWVVGCIIDGVHTDPAITNLYSFGPDGFVESTDVHVKPRSLFMAQSRDMNGEASVYALATNDQYISDQAVYNRLLARYGAYAMFGDPENLFSWLPDTPPYEPTLAEQGYISLLDEADAIDNWSNCIGVSSPVYMGSTSAKWDGVNLDTWKQMKPANLPSDWSGYGVLSFRAYSAVNNGARFVITVTSKGVNGDSDYYMYAVDVNWTGWKTIAIPFTSFTKAGSPVGWHKIDGLTFCNKGYGAIVKSDTELYLDGVTVGSDTTAIHEAEDKTASAYSNLRTGSWASGDKFQDMFRSPSAYVEWDSVNGMTGGSFLLHFTYANGDTYNRPCTVLVNDTAIGSVDFVPTGGWSTPNVASIVVPLDSGNNVVRLQASNASGGPDFDRMDVAVGPTTSLVSLYEAEDYSSVKDSNSRTGSWASGGKFQDMYLATDSYVEWDYVTTGQAETAILLFTYANGSTYDRPCNAVVNGSTLATLNCASTGSWSTPGMAFVAANLNAGPNTVRLQAASAATGVDLDKLEVLTAFASYEAENYTAVNASNTRTGSWASGGKFQDMYQSPTSYVEWNAIESAGGTAILTFTYANGSTYDRTCNVIVNGTPADTVRFSPTGGWSSTGIEAVAVPLASGNNAIRLQAANANGGPDFDNMTVTPIP